MAVLIRCTGLLGSCLYLLSLFVVFFVERRRKISIIFFGAVTLQVVFGIPFGCFI